MGTARNVASDAVNTIAWLQDADTTIVVPVYQRQYRWDIGACEQLLGDVRSVADQDDAQTHFLGSILSAGDDEGTGELVLIDGQQRITTIMLLVAALHHAARGENPGLAADLERVLVRSDDRGRTKLRPHRAWADVFESVVLGRAPAGAGLRDSRFDDNYAFFRSQVGAGEVDRVWRGLRRLEHVAITLGPDANAQQTFESLNSTGEPLRDHELIHNYVLMGLSHAEQSEIEEEFWLPIEQSTGDAIGLFWRHLMIMTTGREAAFAGERGVYESFRQEFPRLNLATLRSRANEWRELASVYRTLLEPALAADEEIAQQLAWVNTFGRASYPLVMRIHRDFTRGAIGSDALVAELERIQSLLVRREVVGVKSDRLVARLCRARAEGPGTLDRAVARVTPSDERVRVALKYGALPHPEYVLGRIAGAESLADLVVEHIVPLTPPDSWSGDGARAWTEYSEDEQNSHRTLAVTLGNLTLLEEPLAVRAFDQPYPAKRELYARSGIGITAALGTVPAWTTTAIADRTAALTERFLAVWTRRIMTEIDDDGLTPILDAVPRRGWPRGWEREFDYVEYCGEHWEVPDIRYLFTRVFKRLWAEHRDAVVAFSARRGGPVYEERAWNGQWDSLDDAHFLYLGWDSRYMLSAVQGVLDEAGLAADVFVKYSYIGEVM